MSHGWPPPAVVQAHREVIVSLVARRSHREGECLIWNGALTTTGYGHVRVGGYDARLPRLVLELATCAHPSSDYALHLCDNKRCVELTHLYWGDFAQNMADMAMRGMAACGERHWNARLKEEEVRAIRELGDTLTRGEAARRFGVSASTITSIVNRRRWRHMA